MVSKKSGLVISVIGVLALIFSVAYMSSCTRTPQEFPYSCNYVVCYNGGHCDSAKCKCPVGYEGKDCSVKTVDHFYGYWKLRTKNIGSDSLINIGKDSTYTVQLAATATFTTFFINNFNNNPNYSHVVCNLDSTHKTDFSIDTTSIQNMYYDHYRIRGGYGFYVPGKDSISALIYIRHLNSTSNWENDTFTVSMKKI